MVNTRNKLGFVLSGGGARSAYQAGVLFGLNEILGQTNEGRLRLPILCGISGGTINAAYLASRVDEVPRAVQDLWNHWKNISIEDVVDARGTRIVGTAAKLMVQLGFGSFFGAQPTTNILDTRPLAPYLAQKINFKKIKRLIRTGDLHALAISATHYGTGSNITFFDGSPDIKPWMRSHRIGRRSNIFLRHVLASAAIPFLFPPVKIQGAFYGDGALRMTSPLSPAIHLGADKIIAIGVRYHRTAVETAQVNQSFHMSSIQLADIGGVLLNSLFMDALDSDLERMERVNQTLKLISEEARQEHPEKLRCIPILALRPSKDLGLMALEEFDKFSLVLRHFLKGLGVSGSRGSDLLSYLAFETSYTTKLLELGFADVVAQKNKILRWYEE